MTKIVFTYTRHLLSVFFILTLLYSCQTADDQARWLRGNLHTHTFWSDGDDFPESAAKWYKENGYDFLVFTDHNKLLEVPATGRLWSNHVLDEGVLWQRINEDHPALIKYIDFFGEEWIDSRQDEEEGHLQVRLKPLEEFRDMFEEPEEFMLIMGNEISDQHAVHFVAIHQDEVIPTVGGSVDERADMIRETVNRIGEYRERSGRNTYAALAHPNFRWAITAEMMLETPDLRYFEVYNGHPSVNNQGDQFRASTELMWDIVLANRLGLQNGKILYGLATDDTHSYHSIGATPGRGWVMIRAENLDEESVLDALDRGDFYSSTGVMLKEINYDGKQISIEIEPQDGVTYTTEYIGTRSGFDPSSTPTLDWEGNEIPNTTRTYSEEIGKVLYSSNDISSSYTFSGEELYVRVKITSSADQLDQITGDVLGSQVAWVQPVVPGAAAIAGR